MDGLYLVQIRLGDQEGKSREIEERKETEEESSELKAFGSWDLGIPALVEGLAGRELSTPAPKGTLPLQRQTRETQLKEAGKCHKSTDSLQSDMRLRGEVLNSIPQLRQHHAIMRD